MTTTICTADFLGRPLVNDNPGVSDATDYLGRNTVDRDFDYLGRALVGGGPV